MAGQSDLYVGLMSGTSLDAVDVVLVRFADHPASRTELLATREHPFPPGLRAALQTLIESPTGIDLDQLGLLDRQLGLLYAEAVNALLESSSTEPSSVAAIGNHGQTIRHRPDLSPAFTLQLGDAATIANCCGIPTVGDFRSADVALGGQGAPLVPAFNHWAFGAMTGSVINIGGIANVTLLRPGQPVLGFDTGPGNTLLDTWYQQNNAAAYDKNGEWAGSGRVQPQLLELMLADPYFAAAAPKSTGREYFNKCWLQAALERSATTAEAADIQATLAELTATTIANTVNQHMHAGHVWLCGGGALNTDLRQRISRLLPALQVSTTADLGIPPAWLEAVAFAWLARERVRGAPAGMPSVTGARIAGVLGSVHLPAEA